MIRMACAQKGFVPLVFSILPDHVHLLVSATPRAEPALEKAGSTGKGNVISFNNDHTHTAEGGFSKPPSVSIPKLVQSIKGTFSRSLLAGHLWQPGYFLWYIDDHRDAVRTADYIIHNYQKNNLDKRFCREPYVWIDHDQLHKVL